MPTDREALLAENRARRARIRDEEAEKDGSDGEEGESGSAESAAETSRPQRRVVIGLAVLSTLLAVAVGVLAYLYVAADDSAAASNADHDTVIARAEKYATTVLTYSSGDYGDLDARIRAISTPEFADRYISSSQEARKGNDAVEASGTAKVSSAGVISQDDSTAKVLVAVDQHVKTPLAPSVGPDGIDYQSRVEITLVREGDDWKLSDLEVI